MMLFGKNMLNTLAWKYMRKCEFGFVKAGKK